MTNVVRLGGGEVVYELTFSNRRTLGVTVRPDGELRVAAPTGTSLDAIETRLIKRGAWILRVRRDFDRLRPHTPPRRHLSGETYRFLGRQYRLRLEPNAPRGVSIDHDHISVGGLPADEPRRVAVRLGLWYQREARRVLEARFDWCWSLFGEDVRPPRLTVRPMEKRWGSLSASGRSLILNRKLVEASFDAIDFVIVHELCHLQHHDHGDAFHTLLTTRMPDWRTRKAQLERWMA